MGLQQFEQRLERLVEGVFAKALRGELQPIELGRRLTREMDLQRSVAVRGLVAPNAFDVGLSVEDFQRFGGFVEVLARELVEAAREHAKSENYIFLGPVDVTIKSDAQLTRSTLSVKATVIEGEEPTAGFLVLADGRRIGIGDEPVSIGRLSECTIPIGDPNASRRHAELRRDGSVVYLIDLGSTNGTRVNGVPVRQHRLSNGDVITIGTTAMQFEAG